MFEKIILNVILISSFKLAVDTYFPEVSNISALP